MRDHHQKALLEQIQHARRVGFEQGVIAAAALADEYNRSTIHDHRLGDCILGRLNMRKGKPRKNKGKIVQHGNGKHFMPKGKKTLCADGTVY